MHRNTGSPIRLAHRLAFCTAAVLIGLVAATPLRAQSAHAAARSSSPARAPQMPSETFVSPSDATRALVQAVQAHDEDALKRILGAGPEVTSSGDAAADTLEREHFVRKYQEMHRLVQEPNGLMVLYIGAENWPFPIPLASRAGRWFFDAATGADEILARRIGEAEAGVINTCRRQAAATGSPADSTNEASDGYQLRRVESQAPQSGGSTAPRPAASRRMITDVRLVAYPVQYRSSGVMTFIVTGSGAVYQRDLGPDGARMAQALTMQVPRAGWTLISD